MRFEALIGAYFGQIEIFDIYFDKEIADVLLYEECMRNGIRFSLKFAQHVDKYYNDHLFGLQGDILARYIMSNIVRHDILEKYGPSNICCPEFPSVDTLDEIFPKYGHKYKAIERCAIIMGRYGYIKEMGIQRGTSETTAYKSNILQDMLGVQYFTNENTAFETEDEMDDYDIRDFEYNVCKIMLNSNKYDHIFADIVFHGSLQSSLECVYYYKHGIKANINRLVYMSLIEEKYYREGESERVKLPFTGELCKEFDNEAITYEKARLHVLYANTGIVIPENKKWDLYELARAVTNVEVMLMINPEAREWTKLDLRYYE